MHNHSFLLFGGLMILCGALRAADLDALATVKPGTTSHRASSFDRSGGNTDNVESFAPKSTHLLLDAAGPGRINHIWLTMAPFPNHSTFLRDLVIRMTWEKAPVAAVEVPLGDFFGLGHAKRYSFQSAPVAVGINSRALNCYWPMPFYKHARIELFNNGRRSIRRVYYHVDYELGPQPKDQGLFHSLFRFERRLKTQAHAGNTTGKDNYVILETEGDGQYAGCALFIEAEPGGWWGEGDDMIFIDRSSEPAIIGTGSEDYFNNAWGYDAPFSYPYYGCPLLEKLADGTSYTTVYRWHIADPIRFQNHIRVTIEHIYSERVANDYSSVAFWYQLQPLRRREPLPFAEAIHPKPHPTEKPATANFDLDATELEAALQSRGIAARAITAAYSDGYANGGWLRMDNVISPLEVPISVPEDATYRVRVKPVNHVLGQPMRIGLKGGRTETFQKRDAHESRVPYLDLGTAEARGNTLTIIIEGGPTIGLDHLRIEKTSGSAVAPVTPEQKSSNRNNGEN